MKLEKKQIRWIAIAVILLAVYNVLSFVIPLRRNECFWVAWGFGLAAILLQIPIMLLAFRGGRTLTSKFYGFSIARVGIIYLIAQMIVTCAFYGLAFLNCPTWIPIVVSVLVLAFAALGVIATDFARDEIERQDAKVKASTLTVRAMHAAVASLGARCADPALKKSVSALADDLRYSDPVSGEATADAERTLEATLAELEKAIVANDTETAKALCESMKNTLSERNRLAKLGK